MPANAHIGELTNSRSQIHEYLNCGYRWDLSYRRGIQSARLREAMDMGTANHRAIKHAIGLYVTDPKGYRSPTLHNKALLTGLREWEKEERQMRGKYLRTEDVKLMKDISHEAMGIAKRALELIELPLWEVAIWKGKPLFEVEVITKLPPWKGFRTIPDLVARLRRERNSGFWLIDWKGRSSFESDDAEEINLQFATMQHVLEIEAPKTPIEGSILWQIKDQAPREPSVNKDGSVSRAGIVTDWPTYLRVLRRQGQDPADYQEMKEKIEQIEWFRALKQHRTSEECRAVWDQIVVPASKAMAGPSPQTIRKWLYLPFSCKGCWAKDFCLAELRGEDTELLLETDYMDTRRPRKRREMGDATRTFQLT